MAMTRWVQLLLQNLVRSAILALVALGHLAHWGIGTACCAAAEPGDSAQTIELFNGRDLSGWVNVNCAADTFTVCDGVIVCSGTPRGMLRTDKMYENYVLELEWKHIKPGGNAGLFVHADALPQIGAPYSRAIEVQIYDGDHGSIFGIRDAEIVPITNPSQKGSYKRATPTSERCHPAGQWNHYVLTSRDATLQLAVNGEVVTKAAQSSLVKGYICLESEHSEVHFRNIRLTPLPSSSPSTEKIAQADEGFQSLFDGVSFAGWQYYDEYEGHWVADDGAIRCDGEGNFANKRNRNLWTEKEYGDFVLVVDWRLPGKPEPRLLNRFTADGRFVRGPDGKVLKHEIPNAGDSGIFVRGEGKHQVNIWCQPMGSGDINSYHKDESISEAKRLTYVPKTNADAKLGRWNRFVITVQQDRVTVVLNGQQVIDAAQLNDAPPRGRLALQNHGDRVDFRNLFIRELDR
jgi:hypothetical protein